MLPHFEEVTTRVRPEKGAQNGTHFMRPHHRRTVGSQTSNAAKERNHDFDGT